MSAPLAAFQPALRAFLRHSLLATGLTVAITLLVGWIFGAVTGYWQVLVVGPVLVIAYHLLFDDPMKWRSLRDERWHLSTTTLTRRGPDGENPVPLTEIAEIRCHIGGRVVVVLHTGIRMALPYLENPEGVAAQIRAARDRLTDARPH